MSYLYKTLTNYLPFRNRCETDSTDGKKSTKNVKRKQSWLGKWESYSVMIQSIIIWDDPKTSLLALIAVNIIFWGIVISEVSLITVCSIVTLCLFWRQQWVDKIWPEIRVPPQHVEDAEEWTEVHPRIISVPEVEAFIERITVLSSNCFAILREMRSERHLFFTLLLMASLSCLASLGMLISGVKLIFFAVLSTFGFCGLVTIMPQCLLDRVLIVRQHIANYFANRETIDILEDFLPEEESIEAQAALTVPLISLDPPMGHNETSDTVRSRTVITSSSSPQPSSLTSEPSSIGYFQPFSPTDLPSYDDSMEDFDGQDLEIPEVMLPSTQEEISTAIGWMPNPHTDIQFVSSHFGSSSSDEEEFTEGLSFRENDSQEPRTQPINTILYENLFPYNITENIWSGIRSMIDGGVGNQPQQQQEPEAEAVVSSTDNDESTAEDTAVDTDDDFEVISDDDVH